MNLAVDTEKADLTAVYFYPEQVQEVQLLRLDKIHPVISGNKWFKLREWITAAQNSDCKGILTFGGAFSNHIVATACAAKAAGLHSRAIIRGEKAINPSPTLVEAADYGMELVYVSREKYRTKHLFEKDSNLLPPRWLLIPEGGAGLPGVNGASGIMALIPQKATFTHILCAVGTGATLAGICNAAFSNQLVTGISGLKGDDSLTNDIKKWLEPQAAPFSINFDFHFGGYAKHPDSLISYMNELYSRIGIPTDIVYTSKLMYGTEQLIRNGQIPETAKILVIHSGGLQGNRSLKSGKLIF